MDFSDSTSFNNATYMRTRLGAKFTPSKTVSAFVQIQDSRTMGSETNTLTDGSANMLDLHQAYVKISPFFLFDFKFGRFEAVYGPQRLIGAVGWHNVGRSFDGFVLSYKNSIINADIFNYKVVEMDSVDDKGDKNVQGVYATLTLIEGHKTDGFIIRDGERNTIGAYGKGAVAGFWYEAEYALQNGSENDSTDSGGMMYALNIGYAIGNIKLSGGVDFVSSDDASTSDMNEAFNTLYATNHKYYGYMDYFLNLPLNTNGLGLNDMHVKVSGPTIMKIAPSVAYHIFTSAQEDASGNSDFGNELDITLKHKFNENVVFVGGYSIFMPGKLKATNGENATFAYLMTVVNF